MVALCFLTPGADGRRFGAGFFTDNGSVGMSELNSAVNLSLNENGYLRSAVKGSRTGCDGSEGLPPLG